MTIERLPLRGPHRRELLCETLKRIEAHKRSLPEIAEACTAAVPDVTAEEIEGALRWVAHEHEAHALALEAMRNPVVRAIRAGYREGLSKDATFARVRRQFPTTAEDFIKAAATVAFAAGEGWEAAPAGNNT